MTSDDHTFWRTLWRESWLALGVEAPDAELQALLAAWSEPQRHYHDQRHLRECLVRWQSWKDRALQPGEVALALWYHDAIYQPQAGDNELRSADWAARAMREAGLDTECIDRVHALIMATRHDAPAETPDAQLLVDIDLAVLGASPQRFDEYDRDVRAEYAWVPEALYRSKRREVLQGFAGRERIYQTRAAYEELEAQARANLATAISRLAS
jgi:predicted metal-dependent HD superfamily phosphohydrolase